MITCHSLSTPDSSRRWNCPRATLLSQPLRVYRLTWDPVLDILPKPGNCEVKTGLQSAVAQPLWRATTNSERSHRQMSLPYDRRLVLLDLCPTALPHPHGLGMNQHLAVVAAPLPRRNATWWNMAFPKLIITIHQGSRNQPNQDKKPNTTHQPSDQTTKQGTRCTPAAIWLVRL